MNKEHVTCLSWEKAVNVQVAKQKQSGMYV
jgi:hypothetical protein